MVGMFSFLFISLFLCLKSCLFLINIISSFYLFVFYRHDIVFGFVTPRKTLAVSYSSSSIIV